MAVKESDIALNTIYNPIVNRVKDSQAKRNAVNHNLYLPQEPPESVKIRLKKDFAHFGNKGQMLN